MRVMVIVKATNDSEDGKLPTPELFEQMGAFNQQLKDAGILVEGDGLKPSAKGARVAFSGQNRSVTKGPFPNVRDLVAGYWIWKVHDLNEAIEWVKRCPNPMPGPSVMEIREFYEMEDFDRSR
ncbi:MAG TPA: YciI family protein [Roseiarcus sp.]